jgi:NAD(P)-dependent dehydrogenase (short-subunit alcohol dehydrogenase family)
MSDRPEHRILVVGCSDGIGLALVRRLLDSGWTVAGLSRRPSPINHLHYQHSVRDVGAEGYRGFLDDLTARSGPFDACVYCAGIGTGFDPGDLAPDIQVLRVNLLAAVETAAALVPGMVKRRLGRFIVLSSQADKLRLANSPAYAASKAGVSSYFESLALAVRESGVLVTNVRFGFIETKMAHSPVKPFLRSPDWAAGVILHALEGKTIRVSRPRRMAALVSLLSWLGAWRLNFR